MGLREMRARRALNSAAVLPRAAVEGGTIFNHGLSPSTTSTVSPEWTRSPRVSKLSAASCLDTVFTRRRWHWRRGGSSAFCPYHALVDDGARLLADKAIGFIRRGLN